MLLQPFVENAVLHGIKNIENGLITVVYRKENDKLCVSIKDNGKGFETQTENSKKLHKSMSMEIIKEQLRNLNKKFNGFNGDISIDTSGKGTEITLHFKAA